MDHVNVSHEILSLTTLDADPPAYPGPTVSTDSAQPSRSVFQLPAFEEVLALYEHEDSLRLPTYQARSLRRYHPYQRCKDSRIADQVERYINTIYDEGYVPLEIPPSIRSVARILPIPLAFIEDHAVNIGHQPGAANDPDLEDERRRRLYRLRTVIIDFLLGVRRAGEAAATGRAVYIPAVPSIEDLLESPGADDEGFNADFGSTRGPST